MERSSISPPHSLVEFRPHHRWSKRELAMTTFITIHNPTNGAKPELTGHDPAISTLTGWRLYHFDLSSIRNSKEGVVVSRASSVQRTLKMLHHFAVPLIWPRLRKVSAGPSYFAVDYCAFRSSTPSIVPARYSPRAKSRSYPL